ncbi:hypothetical protein L596_024090 [Steinernema carpocapsae]|uniref:Tetraspanin n=1 Tax=Steinernema carpocapsae TaxID=34508 RepID=A0A4U5MFQ3_STECR|nr:hypothetical protein L596_024090 [Steinernema carpocapsae]
MDSLTPAELDCDSSWTTESSNSFRDRFSYRRKFCSMGYGGGKCSCCSRAVVILMNFVMMLAGLALIGLVLWIRFDVRFEHDIRQNLINANSSDSALGSYKDQIKTGIIVAFWVLIGFGCAGAILGFIGSISGCCKNRAMLGLYLTCMIIMILLEIAVGIFMLVWRPKIRDGVKNYVNKSFEIGSQPDMQAFVYRYSCCGFDSTNVMIAVPMCPLGQPSCPSAVWDRLDFSLMVAGIVLIGILVLQILTQLFTTALLIKSRHEEDDD